MIDPESIALFLNIQGVTHYVLMDRKGKVLKQHMENPENASRSFFLCFQHLLAVGKQNFRHAVFSTEDNRSIVLFALHDTLLSVITDQDSQALIHHLNQFAQN